MAVLLLPDRSGVPPEYRKETAAASALFPAVPVAGHGQSLTAVSEGFTLVGTAEGKRRRAGPPRQQEGASHEIVEDVGVGVVVPARAQLAGVGPAGPRRRRAAHAAAAAVPRRNEGGPDVAGAGGGPRARAGARRDGSARQGLRGRPGGFRQGPQGLPRGRP